jgi:hypothetical protein
MAQFPFRISKDLFNSLKIGDTLVDTATYVIFTIEDIDYSHNRREIHKIITRNGDALTYSQCLDYHYNKSFYLA